MDATMVLWCNALVFRVNRRESGRKGCPDNVGHSKYKIGKQLQGFVKGLYKISLCALQSHLAGIS